jgi:hypothetical protein
VSFFLSNETKSNGAVERAIKSVEQGLSVDLKANSPPQEAIYVVSGRLNRTTDVPSGLNSISHREVFFKFEEGSPLCDKF